MNQTKMFLVVKVLAVIGLFLGTYLMGEQLFRPAFQPCNINSVVNCNAVVSGAVAKTLGIPTPLYGLVGYIFILYAAIVKNRKLLLFMATFGLVFCAYIAYEELFVLHTICPVCIGCQIDMLLTFILSLFLLKDTAATATIDNI